MNKNKLPRDYSGSHYGIDLNGAYTQKMAPDGPAHSVLQETVYQWLKGTTLFFGSEMSKLTYADFVEHIGCDAQEYRFKLLGKQRVYTWIAADKPIAKFGAFFSQNDNGEWTVCATGSSQVQMPDAFINDTKNT